MESILSVLVTITAAISGAIGLGGEVNMTAVPNSVEVGLAETSPAGPAGGFAVPASGCSSIDRHGQDIHDCNQTPTITVSETVVRGCDATETITVSWDTSGLENCFIYGLDDSPRAVSGPGSEEVSVCTDTTFIINCEASPVLIDDARVRVIPRVQET